jgi:endonuclease/exonuclease/phosphatase family metal-dependent hydrolase
VSAGSSGVSPAYQLVVATYNVRHLRDDTAALVRVIRSLDVDVLCLQETPRHPRWRARLARLARESGLLYACGGRPSGNTAIFTNLRVVVSATREVKFSKRRGLHQRGIALATVSRGGGPGVTVGSVHLGLDENERPLHAEELLSAFETVHSPYAVLAGDLNERPGGPTWSVLERRFRDSRSLAPTGGENTFSAARPNRRIDAVLVDAGIEVTACGTPVEKSADMVAATDHLPVVSTLTVPPAL